MADPVVFPIASRTAILDALTDGLVAYLHLFTSDTVPDDDTDVGLFTEIVMTGYVPRPVKVWTPAALLGSRAYSWGDPVIFEYTAGGLPLPVFGYWATAGAAGPLLWAVRRSGGSFQFTVDNPLLVISPQLVYPLICP